MGGFSSKKAALVEDNYQFGKELGSGSFATVFHGIRRTDVRMRSGSIPSNVAIKRISKKELSQSDQARLYEEVEVLKLISHPGCVKFYESFDDPQYFCLILELMTGGELFDYVLERKKLSESEAAQIMQSVASALAYLHDNSIVHRDIKPENIVFEATNTLVPKLTDFGLAKTIKGGPDSDELTEPCGTPGYVAPEILSYGSYGTQVDVWSLGVILYILLCGYPPFYDEDQGALFLQIKQGDYDFLDPSWDSVSEEAKETVRVMLTLNPKARSTAKQLLDVEWIKNPTKQSNKELGDHVVRGIEIVKSRLNFNKVMMAIKILNAFKPKSSGVGAVLKDKARQTIMKKNEGAKAEANQAEAPETIQDTEETKEEAR